MNSYSTYVTMVSLISIVSIVTMFYIVKSYRKKIPSATRTPNALWVMHLLLFSIIQSLHRFTGRIEGPTFYFSTWGAIIMLHGLFSILGIIIIGMRINND